MAFGKLVFCGHVNQTLKPLEFKKPTLQANAARSTPARAQSRYAQSVRRPLDQSDDMQRVTVAHIAVRIEHPLVERRLKLAA